MTSICHNHNPGIPSSYMALWYASYCRNCPLQNKTSHIFFTSDIFKMSCHSLHISVSACITYISLNYHDNTDTAKNGRFASYLDVFLYIDDFWTRIYNNYDYFNLLIVNFPCVSSNMVNVPLYCVYVYVHTMLTSLSEIIYSLNIIKQLTEPLINKLNWQWLAFAAA